LVNGDHKRPTAELLRRARSGAWGSV